MTVLLVGYYEYHHARRLRIRATCTAAVIVNETCTHSERDRCERVQTTRQPSNSSRGHVVLAADGDYPNGY